MSAMSSATLSSLKAMHTEESENIVEDTKSGASGVLPVDAGSESDDEAFMEQPPPKRRSIILEDSKAADEEEVRAQDQVRYAKRIQQFKERQAAMQERNSKLKEARRLAAR